MPTIFSYRDQAQRLRRTRWTDANTLSQELFLILSTQLTAPDLGPVTIDLGDGNPPRTLRADNLRDPAGGFRLPELDFPELFRTGYGQPDRDNLGHQLNVNNITLIENRVGGGSDNNQPQRVERRRSERMDRYVMVPGKILSGSGSLYTVRLYPYGPNGANFDVTGVQQLQIDPAEIIPADTWTFVWRYLPVTVTNVTIVETVPGIEGEREVSRYVEMSVGTPVHCIQVPVWL